MTKFKLTEEYFMRQVEKNGPNSTWAAQYRLHWPVATLCCPIQFHYARKEGDRMIYNLFFHLGTVEVDDFVPDRDIERILNAVHWPKPKTDKEKIQEKKDKGLTWEYIWPGTLVYIFCMLFVIPIFNERVWGWIAATILYRNYYYEQMTR